MKEILRERIWLVTCHSHVLLRTSTFCAKAATDVRARESKFSASWWRGVSQSCAHCRQQSACQGSCSAMWSGLSYSSVSLLRRSRTMSVFKQQQEVSAARWRSFSAWVEWFVSKAEKEERSEDIICKSTSGCRSCLMITMIFVFIIIKSSLQTGTSNSWLSGLYVPKCKQIKAPKNMKMKV